MTEVCVGRICAGRERENKKVEEREQREQRGERKEIQRREKSERKRVTGGVPPCISFNASYIHPCYQRVLVLVFSIEDREDLLS
jgi:hypothetical protein